MIQPIMIELASESPPARSFKGNGKAEALKPHRSQADVPLLPG